MIEPWSMSPGLRRCAIAAQMLDLASSGMSSASWVRQCKPWLGIDACGAPGRLTGQLSHGSGMRICGTATDVKRSISISGGRESVGSHHVVTLRIGKTAVQIDMEAALFISDGDQIEVAGYKQSGALHGLAFENRTNNTRGHMTVWPHQIGFFVAAVLALGCLPVTAFAVAKGEMLQAALLCLLCVIFGVITYACRTDWLSRSRARALLRNKTAAT